MKYVNVQRANPFYSVFADFDRIFDAMTDVTSQASAFKPTYEVEEVEQGYLLSFDLPGLSKSDVNIEVVENQLRIFGERRRLKFGRKDEPTNGERVSPVGQLSDRTYGRFERAFSLPKDANTDGIQAQMENGVLHLFVPKAAKAQPRKIEIGGGVGAGASAGTGVGVDSAGAAGAGSGGFLSQLLRPLKKTEESGSGSGSGSGLQ